jgi:hypothetical protein
MNSYFSSRPTTHDLARRTAALGGKENATAAAATPDDPQQYQQFMVQRRQQQQQQQHHHQQQQQQQQLQQHQQQQFYYPSTNRSSSNKEQFGQATSFSQSLHQQQQQRHEETHDDASKRKSIDFDPSWEWDEVNNSYHTTKKSKSGYGGFDFNIFHQPPLEYLDLLDDGDENMDDKPRHLIKQSASIPLEDDDHYSDDEEDVDGQSEKMPLPLSYKKTSANMSNPMSHASSAHLKQQKQGQQQQRQHQWAQQQQPWPQQQQRWAQQQQPWPEQQQRWAQQQQPWPQQQQQWPQHQQRWPQQQQQWPQLQQPHSTDIVYKSNTENYLHQDYVKEFLFKTYQFDEVKYDRLMSLSKDAASSNHFNLMHFFIWQTSQEFFDEKFQPATIIVSKIERVETDALAKKKKGLSKSLHENVKNLTIFM